MDFLDVIGASGAAYRFRRADPDTLPPMAGNLVVIAGRGAGRHYLLCGAARSLSQAAPVVERTLDATKGAQLYIRLNVARAVRDAEHADVVAATHPAEALADLP